ncbi:hypothetical protein COPEUT_00332 [Coprococcus eutactus ATCC 27759]|nr:hypothetical protein COPEUT_00332 [Coprococcus eutactus ATCC 27759]
MVVIFIWRKYCGYAFFFTAVGVVIGYFISGFVQFLIIVILLLLSYIFSCR